MTRPLENVFLASVLAKRFPLNGEQDSTIDWDEIIGNADRKGNIGMLLHSASEERPHDLMLQELAEYFSSRPARGHLARKSHGWVSILLVLFGLGLGQGGRMLWDLSGPVLVQTSALITQTNTIAPIPEQPVDHGIALTPEVAPDESPEAVEETASHTREWVLAPEELVLAPEEWVLAPEEDAAPQWTGDDESALDDPTLSTLEATIILPPVQTRGIPIRSAPVASSANITPVVAAVEIPTVATVVEVVPTRTAPVTAQIDDAAAESALVITAQIDDAAAEPALVITAQIDDAAAEPAPVTVQIDGEAAEPAPVITAQIDDAAAEPARIWR